ncbi:MAG: DUF1289 domain-containing protein [Rubrivivax sp.]|nr:DUF1289 domain-containing protein [Rubrivivax sp.]
MPLPSPCINVCRMHARAPWCEGCGRSLDEIAGWSRLDDTARARVWSELAGRLHEMGAAAADQSAASARDPACR